MINTAVQQATAHIRHQNELPPLLTRKQFMEVAGIGESKCAELFNRRDFPVMREFGHPRVPTELLFEWINRNTDWVKEFAPEFGQKFKVI
ncbi:DNA-binding protein [Bacillus sp. IITD106]|nr:DNA-binding protein [Bacillus sp. IITD106]